jgi:two-component system, LuxR family, sensor kinase FixL
MAGPLQMERLLLNLIGNGLKYHRQGLPPFVRVSGKRLNSRVEIRAVDNGIGFDMRYAERIFQPFQRLHGRGQYEGSGMGLAISKRIVEHHRGSITAQSQPGKGSTFIVTLPEN